MPAEWEPHRATWISWPHHEPDWPGKLGAIPWVYAEIARVLAEHEPVEILCHDRSGARRGAARRSTPTASRLTAVRLHVVPTDRVWLRDSRADRRHDARGDVVLLSTGRSTAGPSTTTGARTPRRRADRRADRAHRRVEPRRPDSGERLVLEGGGIDVNGSGLLLVTEEWLLSDVQVRNPGLTREDYEEIFAEWLGVRRTIWLGEGCVGDDTHGHVDDIARFVTADTVVLAVEEDPRDENHERSIDNLRRLELAARRPSDVGPLRIVTICRFRARSHGRRAAAGELRELLHRQRRRPRADFQRSQRSGRARDAGATCCRRTRGRRHPRRAIWCGGWARCIA